MSVLEFIIPRENARMITYRFTAHAFAKMECVTQGTE
jgi:hypothetical protein